MPRLLFALLVTVGLTSSLEAQNVPEERSSEEADVAEIENLIATIQARVDALGQASAQRGDALKFLTQQVEKSIANMESQQDENASLRQKNAETDWRIESLVEARTELSQELSHATDEHDNSISEFQAQVAEIAELLSLEIETTTKLTEENDGLSAKLRGLESDQNALSRSLSEARHAMTTDREVLKAQKEENLRLNGELVALQKQLATSKKQLTQKEQDLAELQELSQFRSVFFGRLRDAIGDHPDMHVEDDRFVFQSEILFETGSAEVGDSGKEQLSRLARTLKDISQEIPSDLDWVLRVDGHTDRRAINTDEFPSNWELSAARAITVVRFLISRGIPANRLAATGFGEFQLIDPSDDEIAYRRNRRIEFKLTQK